MLSAVIVRTCSARLPRYESRRAGLQQRRILYHHALHAEVRAATHHAAVMRVSDIFQRQHAVLIRRPAFTHCPTVVRYAFNQEAHAAVVLGAGSARFKHHHPW